MGRMDRINASMKREIANILLQDLQDPRFQFVSITGVNVSPDLENARVLFSFLGDRKQLPAIEGALKHAAGMVRRLVSSRIDLRHTPRIEFIYDPSLDYSANVESILETIKKDIPFDGMNSDEEKIDHAGEHMIEETDSLGSLDGGRE